MIDASVYPDIEPPVELRSPEEKADYLQRVCGAFDHGLPPTAETLQLFREWKEVFDQFPLAGSPAYHTLRELYDWEPVARLPYLTTPVYLVLDGIEDRTDPCEGTV